MKTVEDTRETHTDLLRLMARAHAKNQRELVEKTEKEYAKLNTFAYEVPFPFVAEGLPTS